MEHLKAYEGVPLDARDLYLLTTLKRYITLTN